MTDIPIKIQFVKSLSTAQPSRIVAVKADGDTAFSLWVTDKTGLPYPLKGLQDNVIITNTDGKLQITSSSTSTNINLASSTLATINSALQNGDNISELINDVGYLTSFVETDPVFQASEARLFVPGDKVNLDNQSGINSGNQTSIVGIAGTKAQFNTELTDGDFLFVGDVVRYTDEEAQDAIGTILTGTQTIDFTYDDTTPSISATVKPNSINASHLSNTINNSEFVNDSNYTNTSYVDAKVTQNITNGVTTSAPSENVVFDALTLKSDKINTYTKVETDNIIASVEIDVTNKVDKNIPIVASTKTKITYDEKGLVLAGADATKTDVGLSNVDNTSDLNKPISTANQTALNLKANDNAVVHLAGNETITGVKSFSPTVSSTSLLARGVLVNPSLTATANNDVLVGLDMNPTFNNGAFTGVKNYVQRFNGNVNIFSNNSNVELSMISPNNTPILSFLGADNSSPIFSFKGLSFRIGRVTGEQAQGLAELFKIFSNGNLVLQNGGSLTDAGFRLDVNGTTRLQSTTTLLTSPTTSAGTYDFLSRNTSTGVIEKIPSTNLSLTGVPTAPTATLGTNTTQIATTAFVQNGLDTKQNTLVSGTNIKTINGTSILGSGDIAVSGGSDVSSDKAILFSGSSIFYFGDSFTNGYASLFSNANNLTGNILSVSGAGWREAIFKSYVNVASFNNSTFSVVMAGLNDLRNAGNNLKTFEKIKSCARSLIVNNFLKSAIPANSGSITASGTWTTTSGITDKASNSLSGLVRVSASSGSTLTYTFTSPNLVIGTFSTDEITTFGGDFSYEIDGGTPITYSGKNKTDGVSVGGDDNSLVPNAIVIRGLSTGAHTVVITSLENAPTRIDYLGTLLPTELCAPVVVSDIPYLNNAGYATAPSNATGAIIDLGNISLAEVVYEFKGFPVYTYKINDFYNSISGDNIHPSNLGYVQIANGLQTVIRAGNAYSTTNPLIVTGSNSNKGYLSNNSDITALGSNFNPITAEIPSSTKASSAIYLGALSSDSFIDFYTAPVNNSIPSRRMRLNKDGKLSIGNTNTNYNFDLSGTARITGETTIQGGMQVLGGLVSPIGSGGFELEYTGGTAFMTAYNRAGGAFLPLSIRASSILFTNTVTVPKLVATGVINLKSYTVSTLPAGIQGDTAYVTDATAPTYLGTLIGGGSVKVPVFFNGTAWVSH